VGCTARDLAFIFAFVSVAHAAAGIGGGVEGGKGIRG
jgi:hypothetical protein